MQISKISSPLMNTVNRNNVSFNGHFRSVEVEEFWDDVFTARVAGSKTSVEYFDNANNAVYKTILKAKDYIKHSSVEKINNVQMDKSQKLGVAEVYFSDEDEKVDMKSIKPYADYIVYAPGSRKA